MDERSARARDTEKRKSRYNSKCEIVRTLLVPHYLKKRWEENEVNVIVRFTCGNEEKVS